MSDKIEEIRARQEEARTRLARAARSYMPVSEYQAVSWQCQGDRAFLLDLTERQARHIDELRAKIDAEKSCACSFDAPGDVCAAHSPALMQERAENERLRAENERLLQAVGLVTTTVSNMEIDIENPVGMAQRVVAEFKKLRAEIEALHEALRRGDGDRFVVERRTTGPDTPVTFIREGKP